MTKKVFIIAVAVALVLGGGVWVGTRLSGGKSSNVSPYSAVYLATGDIYFGKLSWFPGPRLDNVWFLQAGLDEENRSRPGVVAFTRAFWQPIDRVYLNPKQIVFWTRLSKESEVAKALEDPGALEPAPAAPPASRPAGEPKK